MAERNRMGGSPTSRCTKSRHTSQGTGGSSSFVNISGGSFTSEDMQCQLKSVEDMLEKCTKVQHNVLILEDKMTKCQSCSSNRELIGDLKKAVELITRTSVANLESTRAVFSTFTDIMTRIDDTTCHSCEAKVCQMTEKLQKMEREITDLKQQLKAKENEIQKLKSELNAKTAEPRVTNKELQEKNEFIDHLTAQVCTYKEDFETERADRERAQGQLSDCNQQIEQLKQQLDLYRQQLQQYEGGYSRYQTDMRHVGSRRKSPITSYMGDIEIDGGMENRPVGRMSQPEQGLRGRGLYETDSAVMARGFSGSNPSPKRGGTNEVSGYREVNTARLLESESTRRHEDVNAMPGSQRYMGLDESDSPVVQCKPTSSASVTAPVQYKQTCTRTTNQQRASCTTAQRYPSPTAALNVGQQKSQTPIGSHVGQLETDGVSLLSEWDLALELDALPNRTNQDLVSNTNTNTKPTNQQSEYLQCPNCMKAFSLDQHLELLNHMENICMH